MTGQGKVEKGGSRFSQAPKWAGLVLVAVLAGGAAADRPTPSGLPVPRYVTLKFDRVNARAGPGDDHRLLWVYQARGLPVQIVAETAEWRRVCDPKGGLAWVHRRVTDGRRSVINLRTSPQPLMRRPAADAEAAAYLRPQAMAQLVRCQKGWCRVKAQGGQGWAREGALWGTAETRQCR